MLRWVEVFKNEDRDWGQGDGGSFHEEDAQFSQIGEILDDV